MSAHQIVRVVRPASVRGLLTGGPVGPGNWRMSPGQSDAIVSDNHTLGACVIGSALTSSAHNYEDEDGYAGHFVCESVRREYRPLILAAPRQLALLKVLRDDWFEPHYGSNDCGYAALLRDQIRALVAEAEGR